MLNSIFLLYFPDKNPKVNVPKILKRPINIKELGNYDEIILVGSGKGVVSLYKIEKLKWKRKQDFFFKKMLNIYNKYLNSIKYETN